MSVTNEEAVSVEEVACDFCRSEERTILMRGEDWRLGVKGIFTLVRCATCGLVYLNPRPTESDLFKVYPETYTPHSMPALQPIPEPTPTKSRFKKQITARCYGLPQPDVNILERIIGLGARLYADSLGITWFPPPHTPCPRALDFGCGSGIVLKQLAEAGWDAIGIEPNPGAASRARQLTGCEVIVGTIPGIQLDEASLDFVIMQHVLEHLPSPMATLHEISKLLKPGGYARITVPNFSSPEARLLGQSWYAMELTRHFYHFSSEQLTKYLRHCGFEVIHLQFASESWGLLASLKNKWGDSTTESGGAAQLISVPLARTLSITGLGGVMTVYCRKPVS